MSLSLRETYEKKVKSRDEKKSKKIKPASTRLTIAPSATAPTSLAAAFSPMTAPSSIEASPVATTSSSKKRDPSSPAEKASKKRVIKNPRPPTKSQLTYKIEHYQLYDIDSPQEVEPVPRAFVSFDKYNDYKLYINPALKKIEEIPTVGVRLNDLTISRVLGRLGPKALNSSWPADFDQQGMVRATRVPLGLVAKAWAEAGEEDLDGEVVKKGAYYYR